MAQKSSMSVNEAGREGGERVRELIEKGKQAESHEAPSPGAAVSADPIDLIKQDHKTVRALFARFEGSMDQEAEDIASQICKDLDVHAQMEERFFYPAVREESAKQGKELVQDGLAEHQVMKDAISRLRNLTSEDAEFGEVVILLQENVEHHIEEEEGEMLPLARECIGSERLQEIGQAMLELKERLTASIH
jgi:iron-sulfur cluster repair protein YtfE (RIC family)